MKTKAHFELVQALDHWIGLPLCYLIGIWVTITKLFSFRKAPSPPRSIALIKWFGLGSIVLTRDLVKSIQKHYPKAKIIFLTFERNRALIELLSLADEVLTIRRSYSFAFLFDTVKLLWNLSFRRIDSAVDLEFYSKFSTLITYFSGASVRVGFYLPAIWRKAVYTHLIYFNYFRHIKGIYAMAGKSMGVEVEEEPNMRLALPQKYTTAVKQKLKDVGWNGVNRIIGINVNAGELAYCRRWPEEYFIDLITRLSSCDGFSVALIGSAADKEYTTTVYDALADEVKPNVFNTAGIFTLPQLMAFIQLFSFLITNDSGPLHLAILADIPTISIWGPGTPLLYGAKDKGKHKEFYSPVPCSPCMYIYRTKAGYFCNNEAHCLKNIQPGKVTSYALALIDSIKKETP